MKLFSCPHCGQSVYFENSRCLACDNYIRYDPETSAFVEEGAPGVLSCLNATEAACNWRAPAQNSFCRACALNKTIPDLDIAGNRERWIRVEAAKKRVVYTLLALGLEVKPKADFSYEDGIAFDFLADPQGSGPGGERILTGHDNGLITLNVAEADSPEREKMRVEMGEFYRTLLGHFRHELGHYYWDRLIRDDPRWLEKFREQFGDDTLDYAQALRDHYAAPDAPDWQERHISTYAASHPWEDWAESWAHYLHIVDTLEMADALHMSVRGANLWSDGAAPPHAPFDQTLTRWKALSDASNSINRCMGLPDLYPFVISPTVAAKLAFIDELLMHHQGDAAPHA